jgi:hypothetical protein
MKLGDKMDLASYLLKPVQRMGKYALLLKQIMKECPPSDQEFQDLRVSLKKSHKNEFIFYFSSVFIVYLFHCVFALDFRQQNKWSSSNFATEMISLRWIL